MRFISMYSKAVPYARDGTRFSLILTSYPTLLRDGTSVNRLIQRASCSTNYGNRWKFRHSRCYGVTVRKG